MSAKRMNTTAYWSGKRVEDLTRDQLLEAYEWAMAELDATRTEVHERASVMECLDLIARGPNHPGYISGIPDRVWAQWGQWAAEEAQRVIADMETRHDRARDAAA